MDVNIRVYMSKLVVSAGHKVIHEFEPRSEGFPDVIVLSNNTFGSLTHEAVFMLSQMGCQIIYTDWASRQYAMMLPVATQNLAFQVKQIQCHLDSDKRMAIAKKIVMDKTGKEIPAWVKTHHDLLGFESSCAQDYWDEYAKKLRDVSDFSFKRTERTGWNQNPNTGVSCALNYAYGFLLNSLILRYVLAYGLNPSVAFLHDFKSNITLCWDLIEPFRIFADECVYQAIANEEITHKSFQRIRLNGYVLRLRSEAAKKLIHRIAAYLDLKADWQPYWADEPQSWKRSGMIDNYVQGFRRLLVKTAA